MTDEEAVPVTEDQEAELETAAFNAALDGEDPPAEEAEKVEEVEEVQVAEESVEETEEEAPIDPLAAMEERLSNRIRNLDGKYGGMNSELKRMKDAALEAAQNPRVADSPTQAQVEEAVKSGPGMEALREQFPEFVTAFEEERANTPKVDVAALERQFNERYEALEAKTVAREESTKVEISRARQMALLDASHPDWEETVGTQDYHEWLMSQPPETVALTHSNSARDALTVLNSYSEHKASKTDLTANSRQRLESAVNPTKGKVQSRSSPKTQTDYFNEALNRAD